LQFNGDDPHQKFIQQLREAVAEKRIRIPGDGDVWICDKDGKSWKIPVNDFFATLWPEAAAEEIRYEKYNPEKSNLLREELKPRLLDLEKCIVLLREIPQKLKDLEEGPARSAPYPDANELEAPRDLLLSSRAFEAKALKKSYKRAHSEKNRIIKEIEESCKPFAEIEGLSIEEFLQQFILPKASEDAPASPLPVDLSSDKMRSEAKPHTAASLEERVRTKLHSQAASLMTVAEAACALVKSNSTIYRYLNEGKLKWSRTKGRIPTNLVKRLMESEET